MLNADKIRYETTINNLEHFINEWEGRPDHKTARASLMRDYQRLKLELETGTIPTLIPCKPSWINYLRKSTIGEWLTAAAIVFFPLYICPLVTLMISGVQNLTN